MKVGTAALAGIVIVLGIPVAAMAAPGDLTYQGCITGEEVTGPDGSGACAAIPEATPTGDDSGLDRLESVAVSTDGRSVYVAAGQLDHAVAHFNRDPATGALTYVGCMTGEALNTGCTPIATATMTGDNSGLNWPESVAVSPDGLSVYLTSRFDSAIAQFSRDPTTGALDYIGCDSGEDESVPPCDAIGTPTTGGADSGFHDPKHKAAVFSADGRFVYAAGEQDHSIVVFDRDTATGALSFDSCLTGETESIPPCTDTGTATSGGDASGLQQPRWLLMGPDDVSLYAVANNDDAIARFSRDPITGALDFEGCITGDTLTGSGGSGACDEIPGATPNANDSGLDDPRAMAISADGEYAYAVGANDDAVLRFDRDPVGGELDYLGCLTGEETSGPAPGGSGACALLPTATPTGDLSGFDGMRSMAISADGVSLYTSAQADDAMATFDRDPSTGVLSFDSCLTGDSDVACTAIPGAVSGGAERGLDELETIALSADGRSLYGASEFDDAVSRFDREPVPAPPVEQGPCQGQTVEKTSGTAADDAITGTDSTDLIFGLEGDDLLDGVGGSDCVSGDTGKDKLKGGADKDKLTGGAGRDKASGQGGKDTLKGGGGKDRLAGGGGRDKLSGGGGKDRIKTGGGKDKVNCGGGDDKVRADPNDKVATNCEKVT